jgi:hypothetical protein
MFGSIFMRGKEGKGGGNWGDLEGRRGEVDYFTFNYFDKITLNFMLKLKIILIKI